MYYRIRQIIRGENFCGYLLTANVLPLKNFLEYRCCPLTMVPPGLKFSTVSFPYILSFSDEPCMIAFPLK